MSVYPLHKGQIYRCTTVTRFDIDICLLDNGCNANITVTCTYANIFNTRMS